MAETCRLTTLNELFPGRQVSVERSLRYGDELGGHEIAGHITGMAIVSPNEPVKIISASLCNVLANG